MIKIKDFNQEIVSEPVGDDAHIVPQMCRDILVRVDEGINPYEGVWRLSSYLARHCDAKFHFSPPYLQTRKKNAII